MDLIIVRPKISYSADSIQESLKTSRLQTHDLALLGLLFRHYLNTFAGRLPRQFAQSFERKNERNNLERQRKADSKIYNKSCDRM